MKYLIVILFAFTLGIATSNAQNIWFVDPNATGDDTGRDWANAWNYLDSSSWAGNGGINWNVIQPGDTIYISGGTDSTAYYPKLQQYPGLGGLIIRGEDGNPHTFASGDPVVIAPAWHLGHNGGVYFTTSSNTDRRILSWVNKSNVKITGITFVDRRTAGTSGEALILIGGADGGDKDSLQFLEDCHVISPGFGPLLVMSGTKITVRNCLLEFLQNDDPTAQDVFGINNGRGGHTIDGNTIIMRGGNEGTEAHVDGIQISNMGFGEDLGGIYATERLTFTISNNFIIDTRIEGTGWNAMIYSSGPYCNQTFYIYNNVIVNRKDTTGATAIWIGKGGIMPWTKYKTSLHILNNTIITKTNGQQGGIITSYNHDTLIVKNNIFIRDTSAIVINNLDGSDGFPYCYKVFDYNYYGLQSEPSQAFSVDNGVNISWNNWRQAPYSDDVHSIKGTNVITFANKYGLDIQDYYTETGRGQGVNLWDEYPFLRTDALGNPRPEEDAWDIGSLQFQGEPSTPTGVRIRRIIIQ